MTADSDASESASPPAKHHDFDDVLATYLRDVESGRTPDRDKLLDQHPELADELREFFANHDRMGQVAPRLSSPTELLRVTRVQPETVRYFGDYEVLEEIGRGGMGVIYKARQVSLNRIVALKMLAEGRLQSSQDAQRFQIEAEAVAGLDHPHIVSIYEIGAHEGRHYFSMKLIEGGSLSQRIAAGPLLPRDAARLMVVVAQAVHYAHQRGILHRDLKPANILLDASGRPVVTDFGLARRFEQESELTQTGAVLGTPSYMAPEQATGQSRNLTTATDVYALGAVLFALLTGRPPFVGENPLDILLQVKQREASRPSGLNSLVDHDLDTICLKCLEKSPANRYVSAEAFAGDVDRWLRGEPIVARKIGRIARAIKWAKRRPAAAGLIAVSLAAFVALTIGLAISNRLISGALDQRTQALASLNAEQQKTHESLQRESTARAAADSGRKAEAAARQDAEQFAFRAVLERGVGLCERDECGLGLLWLTRGLQRVEGKDLEREQILRTIIGGWIQQIHPLRAVFRIGRCENAGVAFSPDNRLFAFTTGGGRVQVREVAGNRLIGDIFRSDVGYGGLLVFSPNSKFLLTQPEPNVLQLWEIATQRKSGEPLRHEREIRSVAFSRDSTRVATGSLDQTIRCWHVPTGNPTGLKLVLDKPVQALAYHPSGRSLVATVGGPVREWDTETGDLIRTIRENGPQVYCLNFSLDGSSLCIGDNSGVVEVWDLNTHKLKLKTPPKQGVMGSAFSADGNILLIQTLQSVHLLDLTTGESIGDPLTHPARMNSASLSPDGRLILTAAQDGTVRLWDCAVRKSCGKELRFSGLQAMALSPDEQTLLTGGSDKIARLWDRFTGKPLSEPLLHPEAVKFVAFNPDGRTIVTGTHAPDSTLYIWDPVKGQQIGRPMRHTNPRQSQAFIYSAVISPDGHNIITTGNDFKARLWNANSGEALREINIGETNMNFAAFSPDSSTIVTAGGQLQLWNALTGERVAGMHSTGALYSAVRFNSDGQKLVTGSMNFQARIRDVDGLKPISEVMNHADFVRHVAFSSDGRLVFTMSQDHGLCIWEASTGKPIGKPWFHSRPPVGLGFMVVADRGRTILTSNIMGAVRSWSIPAPAVQSAELLTLFLNVNSGLEIKQDSTADALESTAWWQRLENLQKLAAGENLAPSLPIPTVFGKASIPASPSN